MQSVQSGKNSVLNPGHAVFAAKLPKNIYIGPYMY